MWIFQVHKQGRLPSITWRHPSSRALLVRGSSYHHRGVMSIIRGSHANNTGQASDVPTSIEAEQYLAKIIEASPQATLKPGNDNNLISSSPHGNILLWLEAGWSMRGSVTSVNSLAEGGLGSINTPTLSRRNNPFSKAMEGFGTLTRSSGRNYSKLKNWPVF